MFFPKYSLKYGRSVNSLSPQTPIASLQIYCPDMSSASERNLMPRIRVFAEFSNKFWMGSLNRHILVLKQFYEITNVFHCPITIQVYERFDASSIGELDDARFEYFCTKVSPSVLVMHF